MTASAPPRRGALFRASAPAGKTAAIFNLALLAALPFVWTLPLIESRNLFFFSHDVSILSGARDLYASDMFLFLVVAVFAMAVPYAKLLLYAWIWFGARRAPPAMLGVGRVLAKLSMTDVFLFALLLVVVKGIAAAEIVVRPGLYAFSTAILMSVAVSIVTDRALAAGATSTPSRSARPG